MYGDLWRKEFDGQFHDWPVLQEEQTITDIAKRVIQEHQINAEDTVIGTSLGGIVACEIANHVELKRVVLIGSCRKKEEINRILTVLHPLLDLTPVAFIQMSSEKLPSDLTQMFSSSDPTFIRRMTRAIFSWEGLKSEVPVLRIHGAKDRVISKPSETDYQIEGGHLIVMTHPEECMNALKQENKAEYPYSPSIT